MENEEKKLRRVTLDNEEREDIAPNMHERENAAREKSAKQRVEEEARLWQKKKGRPSATTDKLLWKEEEVYDKERWDRIVEELAKEQ